MRESWTDDRMDDLSAKVDRVDGDVCALRMEMKTEFAAVRGEIREGFEKIDKRFDKVDKRFEKIDERFERSEIRSDERFEAMMDRLLSMQRMMFQFCGIVIAALIGVFATLL